MSLSNPQKSLLKRAQRQAGIDDAEYRAYLQMVAGVESSTDPRLGDRQLDKLLALFEAIFWRGVDAGSLQPTGNPTAPFRQRGYWAAKNTQAQTSRDRFIQPGLVEQIQGLEERLQAVGFAPNYIAAIHAKVTKGDRDTAALYNYRAALQRTLSSHLPTETSRPESAIY